MSNLNTHLPKYSEGHKCVHNQPVFIISNLTCRWCTKGRPIVQKKERKEKEKRTLHNAHISFWSGWRTVCEDVYRCSFGLRSEASCIKLPVVSIVIVCLLTKTYKAQMPSVPFICIGLFACPWTLGFTPALPLKQP